MQRQSASLYLSFDEAEIVAADLLRVWPGITGLNETPKSEAIADVVQRVLRKARAIVEERMEISEEELPY